MTNSRPPLVNALTRLIAKRVTIVVCERPARGFVSIRLEGTALRNVSWDPGQKLQMVMGSVFSTRTYTPTEWDHAAGRTRIIGYVHGAGPGSDWLHDAKAGDECALVGPRTSLSIRHAQGPIAFFGDETSVGLAGAFFRAVPFLATHLEMGSAIAGDAIVKHLGIRDARIFLKAAGEAHLVEMEDALPGLVDAGATFVLTGKSTTIQRLRQSLRRHSVPSRRVIAKAYWAPGKTGLD